MKKGLQELLISLLMCAIYPILLFSVVLKILPSNKLSETIPPVTTAVSNYEQLNVLLLVKDQTVQELPLETYIVSVVLREMPADFHIEALKAQAVVARTYTFRHMQGTGKHQTADVCVNSSCCQGYRSPEEYLSDGGTADKLAMVEKAVKDTAGQILVYDNEPIEATYFSCSGGNTEDAVAVWGSDVPYLKSTESPGEENATHYTDTVQFSVSEAAKLLGLKINSDRDFKIGKVTYTDGGGVDTIFICGKKFQGTTVRKKLSLRSTAFVITVAGSTVTVTTKGYGHRVGMSQYGADAMAANGSDYRQILFHYYQGVDIVSLHGFC